MAKQIELCILHSFLLYLFLVPDTYCQHVSGRVFDSSDGEALSGAIIRAVNKKGETLSYVITDKDGGFELVVQSSAIELVASSLGYEELRYPSPFETRYQIAMTAKKEKLDEAIVKARKVVKIM